MRYRRFSHTTDRRRTTFLGFSGAVALLAAAVAATPAVAQQAASQSRAIEFAPGVLTTIPPQLDRNDAISLHDVIEIRADKKLDWKPESPVPDRTLFEMAKGAAFPLRVWCLELSFKPLRMIEVDVPQSNGQMARKLIWYMVYRVRNTGAAIDPVVNADGTFDTKPAKSGELRFIPEFVLESQDRVGGERVGKAYLDRVIPTAVEQIRRRELPTGRLLNSVEMADRLLAVEEGRTSEGVWGVATWVDVDPGMDFFSIFVGSLTNAYRWTDPEGAFKLGDAPGTGRKFFRKKLQLNFWRPGDELEQNEREIRFGAAPGQAGLYDSTEGVASRWVYR